METTVRNQFLSNSSRIKGAPNFISFLDYFLARTEPALIPLVVSLLFLFFIPMLTLDGKHTKILPYICVDLILDLFFNDQNFTFI